MARALIQFIPDRLNAEPVAFRGFTTPELFGTVGISMVAGLLIGLLPGLIWSWVIIPTCSLLMPFVSILLGGRMLVRLKRGRPENWLWETVMWRLADMGFGSTHIVTRTRLWDGRRAGGNT